MHSLDGMSAESIHAASKLVLAYAVLGCVSINSHHVFVFFLFVCSFVFYIINLLCPDIGDSK